MRVVTIILDTRGPDRDEIDRRTIRHSIRDGIAPARLVYEHRGSRDEVLLGLPDAVGWAAGAGGAYAGNRVALHAAGRCRLTRETRPLLERGRRPGPLRTPAGSAAPSYVGARASGTPQHVLHPNRV